MTLRKELVNIMTVIQEMENDPKKVGKMMKIVCIYDTNSFNRYGLRIKTSRINHSCKPNAVRLGNEIRAISNIKIGEEITISYAEESFGLGMQSKEKRQDILKSDFCFICRCEFCQENNDNEKTSLHTGPIQLKIDELIDKAKEFQKNLPIAQSLPEF